MGRQNFGSKLGGGQKRAEDAHFDPQSTPTTS